MGDGAMCHDCRRYACICEDHTERRLIRAIVCVDMDWLRRRGPFRLLDSGDAMKPLTICDREGAPLEECFQGSADRGWYARYVDMANDMLLRNAARGLLDRIDELTPAMNSAFTMAYLHGQSYDGPTWVKELEALRRLV
jgi:DNA-directed RNA polymerase specialized sigma24 family protein